MITCGIDVGSLSAEAVGAGPSASKPQSKTTMGANCFTLRSVTTGRPSSRKSRAARPCRQVVSN